MASIGLPVPKAFVVTAQAFRRFLVETGLEKKIYSSFEKLDVEDNEALERAAENVKALVMKAKMPAAIKDDIRASYKKISACELIVAVRSSATAEDLPDASFAGSRRHSSISKAKRHSSPRSRNAGPRSTVPGQSITGQNRGSTTIRSISPSLCSSWSTPRRPASCSPPTRSRASRSRSSKARGASGKRSSPARSLLTNTSSTSGARR